MKNITAKKTNIYKNFYTICIISIIITQLSLSADTYYVDWDLGNDRNSGLSKEDPWKRAPAMRGFSGSYSHAAGDRFIFKGGVVWPVESMSLYIDSSGTAGNEDYYGIDNTWYKYEKWTNPVFDCGAALILDTRSHRGCPIIVRDAKHVILEGLKITRFLISDGAAYKKFAGIGFYQSSNVRVINCHVYEWEIGSGNDGRNGGIVNLYQSSEISAFDCTVVAPKNIPLEFVTGGNTSGVGFEGLTLVDNCEVVGTTQGIWNCKTVRFTTIRDGGDSFNKGAHENGAWLQNTIEFHNNILTGWKQGVATYLLPGWGLRDSHTIKFYNNIYYNNTTGNGINAAADGSPKPNNNKILIFNNTIVGKGFDLGGKTGGKIDITLIEDD